jgi:hypothetical protein
MRRLRRPRLAAVGAWLQRIDSRVPWPQAVIVVILLAGLVPIGLSASGVARIGTSADSPSPTPTTSASAEPSPETTPPPTPRPTPEGTPAPNPSEPVGQGASVTFVPASPSARATPTATPQPGLWRIEGYVVDENGSPLADVCVVVGPHGCHQYSLRTDEQGHYFLDVAQPIQGVHTTFDFYFQMPGRETVWWRVTPGGPVEFNVVLKKA